MLGRLFIGIVKGLLVGALVGFGLVKLGFPAPGAVLAYLAAAVTGVLIGLIAGKPIWAKDAKIEAGMKAFVGALLGAGLMYAVRRWLTMPIPIPFGILVAPNESLGEATNSAGTVGGVAMTSLATIAGVLGGFYEADNDPSEEAQEAPASATKKAAAGGKRIATEGADEEPEEERDETDKKRSKK